MHTHHIHIHTYISIYIMPTYQRCFLRSPSWGNGLPYYSFCIELSRETIQCRMNNTPIQRDPPTTNIHPPQTRMLLRRYPHSVGHLAPATVWREGKTFKSAVVTQVVQCLKYRRRALRWTTGEDMHTESYFICACYLHVCYSVLHVHTSPLSFASWGNPLSGPVLLVLEPQVPCWSTNSVPRTLNSPRPIVINNMIRVRWWEYEDQTTSTEKCISPGPSPGPPIWNLDASFTHWNREGTGPHRLVSPNHGGQVH
jgi:hypothetical protein